MCDKYGALASPRARHKAVQPPPPLPCATMPRRGQPAIQQSSNPAIQPKIYRRQPASRNLAALAAMRPV